MSEKESIENINNKDLTKKLIKNYNGTQEEKPFFTGSTFTKIIFPFSQLRKIIKVGTKGPYKKKDLFKVHEEWLSTDYENFNNYMNGKGKKYNGNFYKLHLNYNLKEYIIIWIFFFFRNILEFLFPILLKYLIEWLEDEEAEMKDGYFYAGILSFSVFLRLYLAWHSDWIIEAINAKVRNITRLLVVHRVSSLAPGAKKYVDVSKVTNCMVIDSQKLCFYTIFRPHLQYVPFLMIGYMYLIIDEVGILGLASVGALAFMLILQSQIDNSFKNTNKKRMKVSEKRTTKINEIISGIKIVKFNAWEKIMNTMVKKFRAEEGSLIFKAFNLYNLSHAINTVTATFIGLATFLLYEVFSDKRLTVSQIYELVTLFNAIVTPIRYFVMAVLARTDAMNASSRISELAKLKPFEPLEDSSELENGSIEIKDGYFDWEDEFYKKIFEDKGFDKNFKRSYILKNINLRINKGEFVAVIGKVGSGKTSLLLALMNEMVKNPSSRIRKNGKIAYISQETFLQNDTIQNNITFGQKYSRKKFKETLKICQMMPDLEILPGREQTEIGERGINMSGGQKQRVNIARAVYSDSDIYLIDDALSALDAYVGKKIMEQVFLKKLEGKTRVMVTHFLHLLEDVDKVILVDDGEIKAFGTLDEVRKTSAFKDFSNSKGNQKEEMEEKKEKKGEIEENIEKGILRQSKLEEDDDKEENLHNEAENVHNQEENQELGKLIKEEERDTGLVSLKFFSFYMKMAGAGVSTFCIIFFFLSVAAKLGCDWWVGQWMEDTYNLSKTEYMIMYGIAGAFTFLLMVLRSVSLAYVSQISTVKIFNKVIWNVMRRPMNFFDTTPSGVIINRCTNDVDIVDYLIPWYSAFFLNIAFSFLGSLLLTSVVSPVILVLLIICLIVIVGDFKKYFKTAVELKRINQMTVSPMISICGEFIEGASIIRNYGKRESLLEKFNKAADVNNNAYFHDDASIIWIRLRVELSIIFIIAGSVFSVVANREFGFMTFTDSSTSGLIISNLLPLSMMCSSLMYPMLILFKGAVSIQRLHDYIIYKNHEKPFFTPKAPVNWPSEGRVQVKNLSVRYRKNLPLVLNDINLEIEPGEKVAIIGRTGSGKSTSLLTFMRILELSKENPQKDSYIKIDDVKIDEIGLHELRGNLSIIPQDPFLLEGSLRFNIDPQNKFEDRDIVKVLHSVSILDSIKPEDIINQRIEKLMDVEKEKFKKLEEKKQREIIEKFKDEKSYLQSTIRVEDDPEIGKIKERGVTDSEKLNFKIEQRGSNLSIGQRQLICIARALIKNPKILLMDEATANIDQKTDSIIQKLIKEKLIGTTVVTIAHRLITIIQYDKIFIFEQGEKIEEGKPKDLLQVEGGMFRRLVLENGQEFFDKMVIAAGDMRVDPAALFAD